MAQAGARFTDSLLKALKGQVGIVEPCFVQSPAAAKDKATFFATNVELGREGVHKIHPIGPMSPYEQELYKAGVPELANNIQKGVAFTKQ